MNQDQLDRDLAELFAGLELGIGPDSDLGQELFNDIVGGLAACESMDRPGDLNESAMLLRTSEPQIPTSRFRRPILVAAAALVLVGGFAAISAVGSEAERVETSTAQSSQSESGFTPPSQASQDGAIRGVDLPQVRIVPPEVIGLPHFVETCRRVTGPSLGDSAFAEFGYLEGVGDLEPILFAEQSGWLSTCTESLGAEGGSFSYGTLTDRRFVLAGLSFTHTESGPFEAELHGVIGENVIDLAVVEGGDSQVFRTDGRYFRIDFEMEPVEPGELTSESLRVRLVDGTEEVLSSEYEFRPGQECDDAEPCVAEQGMLAGLAGAASQAEVLEDGLLTQSEYASQTARFATCLATSNDYPFDQHQAAFLPSGSAAADAATRCFESELRFVDEARRVQNRAWLQTEEGLALGLQIPAEQQPQDVHGSVIYLNDGIEGDELTEVFQLLATLEIGGYRYVTSQSAYDHYIAPAGGGSALTASVDPTQFPDRIEVVSNTDDFLTTWFTDMAGVNQIRSTAEPVTFAQEDWLLAQDGTQVGVVSGELLPEGFAPPGFDNPELGEEALEGENDR